MTEFVPIRWHGFATLLAPLCHTIGKVVPLYWQGSDTSILLLVAPSYKVAL